MIKRKNTRHAQKMSSLQPKFGQALIWKRCFMPRNRSGSHIWFAGSVEGSSFNAPCFADFDTIMHRPRHREWTWEENLTSYSNVTDQNALLYGWMPTIWDVHDKTRQNKTKQDKTRQDKTRQDKSTYKEGSNTWSTLNQQQWEDEFPTWFHLFCRNIMHLGNR